MKDILAYDDPFIEYEFYDPYSEDVRCWGISYAWNDYEG